MIFFYFFLGFNESVAACLKQLSPSLLIEFILVFLFLSKQENLHVIYHVLELFYDICSTTHQHNQRSNHYFSSMFQYQFDIWKEVIQKVCQ